jgi:nucleoid DNA-binding protein
LDITAFIRELLFGHDCVIIPGFGGFIGNYTPARLDKSDNTFHPPVKQISFNRNLNHNDGLLIGRISESAGLNYADARNLVDEFAMSLTARLAKGEKIVFDHIGSFVNNHEGNVQFEPDRESNYHLNSYGLSTFQIMPLEGYDVRKRIVRHIEKDPVRQASIRKYLWRAAVIIPLLGVMVAVPLKTDLFKTKVQSTNLNPLATVELENNRSAVDKGAKSETKADEISFVKSESVPTVSETVTEEEFCVIAGSFKSEDNAAMMMKRLADEGYAPELVKGPNGFFRVSAIKCRTLSEATLKKDSIGRKYSGTWVARTR